MRSIILECSHRAVEYTDLVEGVENWEEWDISRPTTEDPHGPKRTDREEKFLWYILNELDKDEFKQEKKKQAKKARTIANARKKMNVGKCQPSIGEMLKPKPSQSSNLAPVLLPVVRGADTGHACGNRPGWKSSQAGAIGRVSEPVTNTQEQPTSVSKDGESAAKPANSEVASNSKPASEGGSRANAQTGTMCNNVLKSVSRDAESASSPANSEVPSSSSKQASRDVEITSSPAKSEVSSSTKPASEGGSRANTHTSTK